jgi:hypothetical protein
MRSTTHEVMDRHEFWTVLGVGPLRGVCVRHDTGGGPIIPADRDKGADIEFAPSTESS